MVVEDPLDLRQLSRFLISEVQRLEDLSEKAITLMAALESVNRWMFWSRWVDCIDHFKSLPNAVEFGRENAGIWREAP